MRLPGPRSPVAQARVGLGMLRDPATALTDLHRRYGRVVAIGFGPMRYVFLFGPEANRYLLSDAPENFRWREALQALVVVDGDTALVVSDGPEHTRRRRLVQPAFAQRNIQGHLDVMVDEVDRELGTWRAGQTVDVYGSLRKAVRRIAVRTLFGDSLGARADELGAALEAALEFVNKPLPLQFEIDLPWTAWHRAKAARDRADVIVNDEIARRRARHAADGGPPPAADGADLLDRLLCATDEEGGPALSDVEVRDQVVSLVAAGYDTTSGAAGWVVHELLQHPDEWAQAAAEVHAVVGNGRLQPEHLPRLGRLRHVIDETLRLWPPALVSGRMAVDDFDFAGHRIPGGTIVLYSPWVTQRMPSLWPDPDRFRPDRWAGGPPADPYAFVPFGGGQRRCIGFSFAEQELVVLLVQLLRRTDLTPLPSSARPVGTAAIHPDGGVPVRVERIGPATTGTPEPLTA